MARQWPLGEQPVVHDLNHHVGQILALLVLAKPEADHRGSRWHGVEELRSSASALEVLPEWVQVQAAQRFAARCGEQAIGECAAVFVIGLVLCDQLQVILDGEPLDGPPLCMRMTSGLAVYAA